MAVQTSSSSPPTCWCLGLLTCTHMELVSLNAVFIEWHIHLFLAGGSSDVLDFWLHPGKVKLLPDTEILIYNV